MSRREAERRRLREVVRPGRRVPVAREFPSDALTPVTLFRRMRASGAESFLLESVAGGESVARYTFLGAAPSARLVVEKGRASLERAGVVETLSEPALHALARLVVGAGCETDPDLPPLCAGAVGYLGYDAVRLFEEIPDRHPRRSRMPDALFLLFPSVVAFDHPRHRLLLLTTLDLAERGDPDDAVSDAIARLDALEFFLAARTTPAPAAMSSDNSSFAPIAPDSRFLDAVARAKEEILDGEVYQVVISRRWAGRPGVDPFDAYRALRTLNPSPYLFYLETREATLFGSSPEMLVRCRGTEVETRPIAGTAPRGATPAEDAALGEALLADPKERAEHVMLVDLARNDLGRVCRVGSVRVPRYASVERYSHVQHLVSEVRGTLAPGRTSLDALAAAFPAGTLTGAPKIRAMELIDQLECSRRGLYGGAVGYLDAAGNLDMAIAIRMAVVEGGEWLVQAGAGIVADSVPEKELRESASKAEAIIRAVALAREWVAEGSLA